MGGQVASEATVIFVGFFAQDERPAEAKNDPVPQSAETPWQRTMISSYVAP
jgi:hypothetical protein